MNRVWINVGKSSLIPAKHRGQCNILTDGQPVLVDRYVKDVSAGALGELRLVVSVESAPPQSTLADEILLAVKAFDGRRSLPTVLADFSEHDVSHAVLELLSDGQLKLIEGYLCLG